MLYPCDKCNKIKRFFCIMSCKKFDDYIESEQKETDELMDEINKREPTWNFRR